ncbi:DUF262 domain-containing protein [Aeromicrobium yanjiei]|uniref:DUF262 domain-containing protein n=1 Tax=Aeromicrobium yanjiei TaxID=2662028 RepID=A0A5Q2ML92_9ACTN|nr:DUF262 domain-containing protein [Aeromicrobium yanjiei]QGG41842.1 DUF262 domain-containing protein [Aeromicrobium yanjiei]
MPFEPSATVVEVLRRIQKRELVLPAIQREYVWDGEQIEMLFDSLLRGYPIGQFLSWKVEPQTAGLFRFYDFMRDYNELTDPHNTQLDLPAETVNAVLDGQQRLTSLNIALRGSFADRTPGKWAGRAASYPVRRLYFNPIQELEDDEDGRMYDFRMLSESQVTAALSRDNPGAEDAPRTVLVPVSKLYDIEIADVAELVADLGIGNMREASKRLYRLHSVLHTQPLVTFYREESQEIDRVLDIFIRVNSQGTVLSYSDLLLSIATASWKSRDARKEINDLIDSLNGTGHAGFSFRRDVVLKAGLVLIGVSDIGFKVRNFNSQNMDLLQENWEEISKSLTVSVGLLSDFGLSGPTLPAASVLIPLAYYVHHRGLDESYRTAVRHQADRALLRSWVLRSQVRQGIWGAGLDTLLSDIRKAIDEHGSEGFPIDAIDARMAARGRSLVMGDEEIDDLLGLSYGRQRTFAALAILFPHINTRNIHHIDHVFPRSKLNRAALKTAGFNDDEVSEMHKKRDLLPNLQLIEGPENIDKLDQMPGEWANAQHGSQAELAAYLAIQQLPDLPDSVHDFDAFFEGRKELLRSLARKRFGRLKE